MRALAGLRARWPAARAALIALAIAIGLLEGCPLPERQGTPEWARGIDGVRTALLEPFEWIGKDLKLTQRWALFRGASRKRYRIYVEGKTATGPWQLLHRAGDDDHAAYEDLLAYRRVRGTYSPGANYTRSQYRGFSTWLSLRVLDDHPDFLVARTRMERILIGEGGYTPTGEFTLEQQEIRRRK
jgi:hypothetical protein